MREVSRAFCKRCRENQKRFFLHELVVQFFERGVFSFEMLNSLFKSSEG